MQGRRRSDLIFEREQMNEIVFTGPPIKLAMRTELIEELCDRNIPSFVFYQAECADGDEDTGEVEYLTRHSFDDRVGLARMLRMVADSLEDRERETTITSPAQFRE
jgi:hypothetical protein